jgi:hypothetical protein
MITSAEEFVALTTSDNPEAYRRAASDSAPEDVWLDVIRKYPHMRKWVAHNKSIPAPIINILAMDPDEDVRFTVAQKRSAGPAILRQLAADASESVRQRVAYNAKTPLSVLEKLAADECELVAEPARKRLSQRQAVSIHASGPGEVQDWLRRYRAGSAVLPTGTRMRNLAQLAGFRAQRMPTNPGDRADLEWARVAIDLYEEASRQSDERTRIDLEVSAMTMRALMIERHGIVEGDYIQDPQQITRWFFERLPMTLEEATRRAAHWRLLPIAEIRELRVIKNRLRPLETLRRDRLLAVSMDLDAWLARRHLLP